MRRLVPLLFVLAAGAAACGDTGASETSTADVRDADFNAGVDGRDGLGERLDALVDG